MRLVILMRYFLSFIAVWEKNSYNHKVMRDLDNKIILLKESYHG